MTQQFDEVISAKREELDHLRTRMERLRRDFEEETAKFFGPWFLGAARTQVEQEAELTLRLGAGRLADVKREVEGLAAGARQIAAEVLDRPGLWWHLREEPRFDAAYSGASEYRFEDAPPQAFIKAIDRAFGRLRAVLVARGYLDPKFTLDHNLRHSYEAGRDLAAANSIAWPGEMKRVLHEYGEAADQGTRILQQVDDVERQKRRHLAGSLWDSV